MLGLRNVGKPNLRELERALAVQGLSLRAGEATPAPKDPVAKALALLHSLEQDLDRLKRRVAAAKRDLLRDG